MKNLLLATNCTYHSTFMSYFQSISKYFSIKYRTVKNFFYSSAAENATRPAADAAGLVWEKAMYNLCKDAGDLKVDKISYRKYWSHQRPNAEPLLLRNHNVLEDPFLQPTNSRPPI